MTRRLKDLLAKRRQRKARRPVTEDKALRPDYEDKELEKWTLKVSPEEYLEKWPNGPNADLARRILGR